MNLKTRLESIKQKKKTEKTRVMFARVNHEIRDAIMAQLKKDNLTLKDLMTAVASEYTGKDFK